MADISKLSPKSGRIIGEDGKIYNRVSLLRGTVPVSDKVVNIAKLAAESGRLIGEDGKIYNEVDLLNGLTGKMDDIESEVTELSKLKNWLGETTTPITVNSTTNPITISGVSVMATAGDVTAYDNGATKDEFIFSEAGTWQVYDDKLDVYTKDETDALLADKMPNTGNTKTGSMYISRDFITTEGALENNVKGKRVTIRAFDESGEGDGELIISAGNGLFDAGIEVDESGAITILAGGVYDEEHDTVTAQDGQLYALSGKTWHLVKEGESKSANTEIARKGDLTGKLDKTGGAVTGQITTNQTTFDNDQQLVTKKYVDDNAGGAYTETVLWTNPNIDTTPIPTGNITLNAALNNFDAIFAVSGIYYGVGTNLLYVPCVIPVSQLMLGHRQAWTYSNGNLYDIQYVDTTHLTLGGAAQSGAYGQSAFEKIIGINYGEHVANFEEEVFPNA